jgi:Fic family protein
VHYLNWEDLHRALDYDIQQERQFSYKGLTTDQQIQHITRFVSGIWQIHAFGEGNTRTTAVFAILYLRDLGYKVENDMFAQHSWYFRNALVRANYRNAVEGIDYAPEYLERFFRNLLLSEQWDLRNRYLHIHPTDEWRMQPNLVGDVGINPANVGINVGINAKESKLLELLINNNSTTAVEAASILHLSVRQVERLFAALKAKGILSREGSNKSGRWIIISNK